ncbi:MAG: translation initiation factor IF-2 [Armatimonadetes bacterium]|nr:translation initiation factor IF-2 [Armatimonadota bacterium]
MRLHELAKEFGVATKDVAERLAALGFDVKANPNAAIPEPAVAALRASPPALSGSTATATAKKPARTVAKAKAPTPPPAPEPPAIKRRIIKRADEVERDRVEADRIAVEQAAIAAETARDQEETARQARLDAERAAEAARITAAAPPPPPPAPVEEKPQIVLPKRHAEPAVTVAPEVMKQGAQPRPEVRKGGPPPMPPRRPPVKAGDVRRPGTPPPPPPPPRPRHQAPRSTMEAPRAPEMPVIAAEISLGGPIMVADLAAKIGVPVSEVVKRLISIGVLAGINQQLPEETARKVARELGVGSVTAAMPVAAMPAQRIKIDGGELRPPVVTVMGHVDHGKTSLLDAIRKTNVSGGEFGGITQHIGAYQVELDGKNLTFIDTPGHEAFTTLRARGAQVTDVAVIVVAADDGVMPQTVEAISHAKAAGVPIVVAMNKMDIVGVNPDRVKQQLSEHGLVPEDWGGDTVLAPVSARTGEGLREMLEMILLVSEIADLHAERNKPARGTVLESRLEKGRGPVATVLVQEGTLRTGDVLVAGESYGKVRAMSNDRGQHMAEAGPSTPAEVIGLNEVATAGDLLEVVANERRARAIAEERRERRRTVEMAQGRKGTLEESVGALKELRLILKADVQGSLEAITAALARMGTDEVAINVIHTGVGGISESDVMLAAASRGAILGFNVRPDSTVRRVAEKEGVDIRTYRIIYEALDDVGKMVKGLTAPVITEVVLGRAQIRQVFSISRFGNIAGCYVTDGKLTRTAGVRLLRDDVVIYEGKLASLKRFKDDAREVVSGFECGLQIENYNDIKEGDVVEAFIMQEQPAA